MRDCGYQCLLYLSDGTCKTVAGRSHFQLHTRNSLAYFPLLLLLQSYIMACLRGSCPSSWQLKSLCSAHRRIIWACPPVNSYNKKKRLTPKGWPFLEVFWETKILFTFLPLCLSLSILPFDCSSSLLLALWLYKTTWHLDPDKMVTLRC